MDTKNALATLALTTALLSFAWLPIVGLTAAFALGFCGTCFADE